MKTMKQLEGSIVLEKGHTILAYGIMEFMKIYGFIFRVKPKYGDYYSHAETIVWLDDLQTLGTCGAINGGARVRVFTDKYPEEWWDRILVLTPKNALTEKERQSLREAVRHFAIFVLHRYQVFNFIAFIALILSFGILNLFRKKNSEKKVYCYELAARLANRYRKGMFENNPEITTMFDIMNNTNYKKNEEWKKYFKD